MGNKVKALKFWKKQKRDVYERKYKKTTFERNAVNILVFWLLFYKDGRECERKKIQK